MEIKAAILIQYILPAVLAYLLGSVSASVLLSKLAFHKDVRSQGSGNAGATNVARTFGMGAGIATLLCDAGKTVLAMFAGRWLGGQVGMAIAGGACLAGHCWPVYFRFKGGKGVSVGAVIGAMIDWRVFLIIFGMFCVGVAISRIVSVGSIAAAVSLPVAAILLHEPTPELCLAVFTGVLVTAMHWQNIRRLIRGEEKKFKPHTASSKRR